MVAMLDGWNPKCLIKTSCALSLWAHHSKQRKDDALHSNRVTNWHGKRSHTVHFWSGW